MRLSTSSTSSTPLLPLLPLLDRLRLVLVRWERGQGQGQRISSSAASASALAPAAPFVWHNNATSDDHHRISENLSYFPRFLSDTQQRTLLNAALERLDYIGSYASRRKRLRLLKSTIDTDTDTNANTSLSFLPDEYYDFEQVSQPHPYRPFPPSLSLTHSFTFRLTLTESSSSSGRPASPKSTGPTKKMSSPSSPKSPLYSHHYPSRHISYTSPPMATYFLTSIIFKRAVPSSLASV